VHAGRIIEVDVYEGRLAGLITAEVEFPDESTAAAFEGPAWLDAEVTGVAGWSNARLAVDGAPRAGV
ncbi:MAG: hypothetical protein AAF449_07195, partial [Myxococcota bacterium]